MLSPATTFNSWHFSREPYMLCHAQSLTAEHRDWQKVQIPTKYLEANQRCACVCGSVIVRPPEPSKHPSFKECQKPERSIREKENKRSFSGQLNWCCPLLRSSISLSFQKNYSQWFSEEFCCSFIPFVCSVIDFSGPIVPRICRWG